MLQNLGFGHAGNLWFPSGFDETANLVGASLRDAKFDVSKFCPWWRTTEDGLWLVTLTIKYKNKSKLSFNHKMEKIDERKYIKKVEIDWRKECPLSYIYTSSPVFARLRLGKDLEERKKYQNNK